MDEHFHSTLVESNQFVHSLPPHPGPLPWGEGERFGSGSKCSRLAEVEGLYSGFSPLRLCFASTRPDVRCCGGALRTGFPLLGERVRVRGTATTNPSNTHPL